ncbi:MAG: hypothetical protein NC907_05735 [Candidatus Omnitrophica bacterium]|nr:hypothetical protein [Candidatus Omnitrophota bacterium]MCM8789272.1 hypothetical protein [Candidatus Omnitrophota bacterium]
MKKAIAIIGILGIVTGCVYGRETPLLKISQQQPFMKEPAQGAPEIAGKVKELIEIQKKMFDIERNVIQQDQELKQIAEQIRQLQQQLREKIEQKLKDNEEYQVMKQRREQIRQQYKKIDFSKQHNWRGLDKK